MNSHRYGSALTINFLPHNVFIEIFDLYRMDEVRCKSPLRLPWKWHTLAHVCRIWRDFIFSSSRRLNLELLCTNGTPVRKNLGYLPAFPIVIELPVYTKESDEDNIIAALEHPNRIRVVRLHVSCSLLEKMATVMQQPFPVLTDLFLEWEILEDKPTPVLPDAFLGGCAPHLQTIRLNGIPFPAAPALLSSARDLVDVDLRNIPDTGYIAPDEIVASLATLPRLECLIFQFQFGTSYSDQIRLPPLTRTALPSLTTIWFQGPFKYFEYFVAQVDAPQLKCLEITYSDRDEDEGVDFQIPQLSKFIDLSETLSRFKYAEIDVYPDSVDMELLDGSAQPDSWYALQRGPPLHCCALLRIREAERQYPMAGTPPPIHRYKGAECTIQAVATHCSGTQQYHRGLGN
ncbi:hypothetical protein V8E53_011239 [Lactarius tabidus]